MTMQTAISDTSAIPGVSAIPGIFAISGASVIPSEARNLNAGLIPPPACGRGLGGGLYGDEKAPARFDSPPSNSPPQREDKGGGGVHRRWRGYSLLEMSIILAVMGLLLGGALLPFASRVRSENYREADTAIQDARDAVVAYAMRSRTVARAVAFGEGAFRQEGVIPAGRPYLPCPDVDGDGVEDRSEDAFDDAREALSGSVYDIFTDSTRMDITLVTDSSFSNDSGLRVAGTCQAHKGVLPWITLGVPPADRWGNRFTYRVDPAFSSAALGFDETSRADALDVRGNIALYPYIVYTTRREDITSNSRRADQMPTLICDDTADCRPAADPDEAVIAGVVTEVDIASHSQNPRPYEDNDIIDGIPFVIVSHGQNGYGAVNHHTSIGGGMRCNPRPRDTDERHNANRIDSLGFITDPCNDAYPANEERRAHFIAQPRHRVGDNSEFDDIVVWMSASELIGELARNGIFPVEKLPY